MQDQPSESGTRRDALIGIALITAASLLWSLNGALIKIISDQGRGPGGVSIAFYRSLIGGLFLLPLTWNKWGGGKEDGRASILKRPAALWCVVFFTLMTVLFVVANTITQAASVIILQYTSTFWIFALSPLLLRERPRASDFWILALAMAGIGIIFFGEAAWDSIVHAEPGTARHAASAENSTTNFKGMTIALGSGLFYALLTLMIRRLRDADSAAVTVMNNLGSALLLFPLAAAIGGLAVSPRSLAILTFMGVVQFGFPYYLYALGLKKIRAYQAALITLLEPVLVPIWAVLAIGASEVPPVWTLVGGGVIFTALLLFIHASRRMTPVPQG